MKNIVYIEPELLAPAGNYECFLAAVNAGANAVYLAGDRFGARAYAGNFSNEEIIRALNYAHLFNVKIYLTVNTLIKEREAGELTGFLGPLVEAGLDGVIIQDLGAARLIREAFPELKLCASTQMTLTGEASSKLAGRLGFSRVILARELSLEEIRKVCKETDLEVEVFIHGAMCYSVSGQCLFSSMLGERSANRGRCAGPCRMEYSCNRSGKQAKGYLLSLRDMETIDHIPELIRAGVKSFKIEGRMKPPEYVAGIVSVYRKYIDKFLANPDADYVVEKADRKLLNTVYIRTGAGPGYLTGKTGAGMISLDSPAYTKSDEAILEKIRREIISVKRKISIEIEGYFYENEPAVINARLEGSDEVITVTGPDVLEAKKAPLSEEKIVGALSKLGNTVFSAKSVNVYCGENIFLPVSEINGLRRQVVVALEAHIIERRVS